MYFFLLAILFLAFTNNSHGSASSNVEEISFRNVADFLSSQPVILEFYAPWCKHCKGIEPSYELIAKRLKVEGVRTGRIDISSEPALAARFAVHSVPTFFLYRERKMWNIKGMLTLDGIVEFCTTGYGNTPASDIWSSPVGPIGNTKGLLIGIGGSVMDSVAAFSGRYGIPVFICYVIFAIILALAILLCTFMGIIYSVGHIKAD